MCHDTVHLWNCCNYLTTVRSCMYTSGRIRIVVRYVGDVLRFNMMYGRLIILDPDDGHPSTPSCDNLTKHLCRTHSICFVHSLFGSIEPPVLRPRASIGLREEAAPLQQYTTGARTILHGPIGTDVVATTQMQKHYVRVATVRGPPDSSSPTNYSSSDHSINHTGSENAVMFVVTYLFAGAFARFSQRQPCRRRWTSRLFAASSRCIAAKQRFEWSAGGRPLFRLEGGQVLRRG